MKLMTAPSAQISADEVYLSPCCNISNENQFQVFEKLTAEAIYFFDFTKKI